MITVDGKCIPESLAELLDPARTAHLVIDLQNDCCHPDGGLARAGGDVSAYPQVIERVGRMVDETRRLGVLQVFIKIVALPDGRSDSPSWIWLLRRMTTQYRGGPAGPAAPARLYLQGGWGAEFIDGLPVQQGDLVVEKLRSSVFFGTNLDMLLRSNGIQALVFSGCTTEGCVESSVRDAGFLDYFPIVVRDCVASDVPELHEASLRVMTAYRAEVVSSDEVVEALRANIRQRGLVPSLLSTPAPAR